MPFVLEEATTADLQAGMEAGRISARSIVELYLERIDALDRAGPALGQVIEVNPDALAIADALDAERKARRPARSAARHPDPHQGQHRTPPTRWRPRPARSRSSASRPPRDAFVVAAAARGRRGHPRQDQPQRVGELPLDALVQRLERARRADAATPTPSIAIPPARARAPAPPSRPTSRAVGIGTETDGSIVVARRAARHWSGSSRRSGWSAAPASSRSPTARTRRARWRARSPTRPCSWARWPACDPRDAATAASRGQAASPTTRSSSTRDGLRGARIGVPARAAASATARHADALAEAAIAAMQRRRAR